MFTRIMISLLVVLALAVSVSAGEHPSYSPHAQIDSVPFYAGGSYNPAVPHPNKYLQHDVGQWPARYYEVEQYLAVLANSSDRVKIDNDGETFEGRELYSVFISSPKNISALETIRQAVARLANNDLTQAAVDSIADYIPAVAWLGYSVHGDEVSGTDAAMQLMYQLAAGTDSLTEYLLDNLIVIIQPSENPDGRERYLSMLQTYKSSVPNWDMSAMQHSGVWPWGRTNHYLFDLNRDYILLRQPETRARFKVWRRWNPQLVVDGHEMWADASFLFSPPREPINYNIPDHYMAWADVFAQDQGKAFDKRGWTYYSGEWNEQWYPGYCSAWPTYSGAVGILYEMAGVDGTVVKQSDNYLLSYHEAVNKHFTSSLANLATLANNRAKFLREYYRARRDIVAQGKRSNLTFLFRADRDEVKMKRFIESLTGQGIQVRRATAAFTVGKATDRYGKDEASVRFPVGSYLVSTAQPMGALAKAVLEFDPRLKLEFLEEERRELEKHGESRMYEVSAWSPALAYDLDAYYTTQAVGVASEPVDSVKLSAGGLHNADAEFAFIVPMVGEKTYRMLSRLFAEDVIIRASKKPFKIEGRDFEAGSLVLRVRGNNDRLAEILGRLATEVGIDVYGVSTGFSESGSKLGADTFVLLSMPKIAILAGDGIDYSSFGELWCVLDQELHIPHSLISLQSVGWNADLSKYNVLIVPSSWGPIGGRLGEGGHNKIQDFVEDGGTLICIREAAAWAADTSVALSQARIRRQSLDKLEDFALGLKREQQMEAPVVDTMALWHPDKVPPQEPEEKSPAPGLEDAKDRDAWARKFTPQGAILKVLLDTEDWLAFGMGKDVPALVWSDYCILSKAPVHTVGRFADVDDLRMSGLLWPEARERIANSAYVTRESRGKGQIIMFAVDPDIRAYFYGTRQLFVNAVLYGPGLGSRVAEPYE